MHKEKLADKINNVIQEELKYDKDLIASDGWNFLENEAPNLIMKKIIESEEEIDSISETDIQNYLNDAIYQYEQTHANIRFYS